jgi:class 3 adenylate cyclase
MRDPFDRFVRYVARRNSYALMWAQFGGAHIVLLGGVGLLRLYQNMSTDKFVLLIAVSQGLGLVDNIASIKLTRKMWRPVWAWERGARDPESTVAAWRALACLPLEYFRRIRKYPLLLGYVPYIVFTTFVLDLSFESFLIILFVGTSVLACGVIVRYFTMEIVCRPVLEVVAAELPEDFTIGEAGLPLRWRLLIAAPVINIVTALVVSGLAGGTHQRLGHLAVVWVLAVAVSLTLSLELVFLGARSIGTALRDMQAGIERVQRGDFTARIPVVSTDETGLLAQSFNEMVEGLAERETLREAFGAYVDPGLAERVLRDGADLEGEDVEVSVLFLDIREFTAFSERARPRDVVALLNEFWELVVPIVLRWGGHANKFIGDGLLAVFGAPDSLPDHAQRATAAALEIAEVVQDRYRGTVQVGIGVNTGRVIAGTVGGGGRIEFTVIGDAVNTAARVEQATRDTGDAVLITEATRRLLADAEFEFEHRPPVPLRGKTVPVQLWAPHRRRLGPPAPDSARRGVHTPAVWDTRARVPD